MSRDAIEVGAFTWDLVQRLYDADPAVHWQRCATERLECPREVLTQLFHEDPNNDGFAAIVRRTDWGRVSWELQEFSGVALRHVRVDRKYQYALDEARDHTAVFGVVDELEEVERHWRESHSWFVPPVIIDADLLGGGGGFELLLAFTRLGNLLGMPDREEVLEVKKHLVWAGRRV